MISSQKKNQALSISFAIISIGFLYLQLSYISPLSQGGVSGYIAVIDEILASEDAGVTWMLIVIPTAGVITGLLLILFQHLVQSERNKKIVYLVITTMLVIAVIGIQFSTNFYGLLLSLLYPITLFISRYT